MIDLLLEPAQFDAVVRHEAAHLRHRHPWYLLVAAAVEHTFGVVPLMARGPRVLRLALERWADEDAAAATADGRTTLRLALVNVALLVLAPAAAAFSGGDVLARIEAMEGTPVGASPVGAPRLRRTDGPVGGRRTRADSLGGRGAHDGRDGRILPGLTAGVTRRDTSSVISIVAA